MNKASKENKDCVHAEVDCLKFYHAVLSFRKFEKRTEVFRTNGPANWIFHIHLAPSQSWPVPRSLQGWAYWTADCRLFSGKCFRVLTFFNLKKFRLVHEECENYNLFTSRFRKNTRKHPRTIFTTESTENTEDFIYNIFFSVYSVALWCFLSFLLFTTSWSLF